MCFYIFNLRFNSSTSSHFATSQAPVVHQIEEMRETIQKLNVELMTKDAKERTLEEKMEQLMKLIKSKVNAFANKMSR